MKTQKDFSFFFFTCWELSRVNSFIFLFFPLGVNSRIPYWKCLVALICMIVDLTWIPYYFVFSLELNACRFQLSLMHVHYYYYTHHSVMQVKGNNDDIWWTDWDGRNWYELDLSCFCKYDEFIVPDSAYYEVSIFAMTFIDYSCLCHAWLAMSYNGLPCMPTCY